MFRVILIFFVIYLVVRLFQSYSRSNSTNQSRNNNPYTGKKEGEISVENFNSQKNKKVSKNDGEYVNYEEL
jgi:preprotein translocase subunit SecG